MSTDPQAMLERTVCVYCASSTSAHPEYRAAAFRMGEVLAARGITLIYGGGSRGSMGALADGALGKGGRVVGVLPRFMADLEWGHQGLSELKLVEDMRTRKHLMLTGAEAAIALPGGCGTLEELLEAITLKRLGLFLGPIVLVNTRGFFPPAPGVALPRRRRALHGRASRAHVAGRRPSGGCSGSPRACTRMDRGVPRLRGRIANRSPRSRGPCRSAVGGGHSRQAPPGVPAPRSRARAGR